MRTQVSVFGMFLYIALFWQKETLSTIKTRKLIAEAEISETCYNGQVHSIYSDGLPMFYFIVFLLIIASLVLPWVNWSRLADLQRSIKILEDALDDLTQQLHELQGRTPKEQKQTAQDQIQPHSNARTTSTHPESGISSTGVDAITTPPPLRSRASSTGWENPQAKRADHVSPPASSSLIAESAPLQIGELPDKPREESHDSPYQQVPKESVQYIHPPQPLDEGFERHFGAKLSVWLGAIALMLAGFYLVKYSIEVGWFGPLARITLGALFGIGLLIVAETVQSRMIYANGPRIAQALAGAGIAVLYGVVYAATNVYFLLPPLLGFVGMAATTTLAVLLSLRHGAPLALLCLLGGFSTPLLISTGAPAAATLFPYLFIVFAGLLYPVQRLQIWWVAILAVICLDCWVGLWLINYLQPGDSFWLSSFLLAVSISTVIMVRKQGQVKSTESAQGFNMSGADFFSALGLFSAVTLMGFVTNYSGYGLLEWSYFAIFAAGGMILAWLQPTEFRFVPKLILLTILAMLAYWHIPDASTLFCVIGLFAVIFIVAGYFIQRHSTEPLLFATLVVSAALGFYLLAYYKLYYTPWGQEINYFWGSIAMILAALAGAAVMDGQATLPRSHPEKSYLLAMYTLTASAFISIGLSIELPIDFLPLAIAAQTLAVAWVNRHTDIVILRPLTLMLLAVFGFLMISQWILLLELSLFSVSNLSLGFVNTSSLLHQPWLQVGLPGLLYILTAWQLLQQRDDNSVRYFEFIATALLGLLVYYESRALFQIPAELIFAPSTFTVSALATNLLFAFAVLCLVTGHYLQRIAICWSGVFLAGIAIFRIVYFDLLFENPLFHHYFVGAWPLINSISLAYLLPIVWFSLAAMEFRRQGLIGYTFIAISVMLICLFMWVTCTVRHAFTGAYLDVYRVENLELYMYSLAWVCLSIILLLVGIWRKQTVLRGVALSIMVLTAAKVFLWDAAELEGLYRVLSFFGLGVSLIGLSYLYSRFVFINRPVPKK
jgi:uncharacterized membrane protein